MAALLVKLYNRISRRKTTSVGLKYHGNLKYIFYQPKASDKKNCLMYNMMQIAASGLTLLNANRKGQQRMQFQVCEGRGLR